MQLHCLTLWFSVSAALQPEHFIDAPTDNILSVGNVFSHIAPGGNKWSRIEILRVLCTLVDVYPTVHMRKFQLDQLNGLGGDVGNICEVVSHCVYFLILTSVTLKSRSRSKPVRYVM
jgi:hypothetical protein